MKKAFALTVLLAALIINFSWAQEPSINISDKPGWHKIGEVKADFKMEKESITVLGKDVFKSILLKVTDAPINIESIQIKYESGAVEDVPVSKVLQAGNETSAVELKHPTEEIESVTFTYKTLPNSKEEKAHVELYGFKS